MSERGILGAIELSAMRRSLDEANEQLVRALQGWGECRQELAVAKARLAEMAKVAKEVEAADSKGFSNTTHYRSMRLVGLALSPLLPEDSDPEGAA